MLKTSKAVVAALLIAGSASTAFADGRFDVSLYHANPTLDPFYQTQYRTPNDQIQNAVQIQNPHAAFAYAPRTERRHAVRSVAPHAAFAYAPRAVRNSPYAVYENGQYAGQDPDIHVRSQLLRETPPQ